MLSIALSALPDGAPPLEQPGLYTFIRSGLCQIGDLPLDITPMGEAGPDDDTRPRHRRPKAEAWILRATHCTAPGLVFGHDATYRRTVAGRKRAMLGIHHATETLRSFRAEFCGWSVQPSTLFDSGISFRKSLGLAGPCRKLQ